MYFKFIPIFALIFLLTVGAPVLHAVDDDSEFDDPLDLLDLPEMEIDMSTETNTLPEPDFGDVESESKLESKSEADAEAEVEVDAELEAEGVTDYSANALSGGNGLLKDVILVLDNSGSMKKNDPNFLTKRAVTEFISGLDESTRIAIVIFDQDVSLAVPLTQISSASKDKVSKSLDKINYKGLFTDSPAAVERAIYELKNSGRGDAQKLIIFMTDGIVDTGNKDVDLEKSKWLKDSLAADAADADIRIFGIAFTEYADFQLIQSLAQKTDGEYYRALKAEDLQNVFERITTIINTIPEPDVPIVHSC